MTKKKRASLRLVVLVATAVAQLPAARAERLVNKNDKSVHGVVAVGGTAAAFERSAVNDAARASLVEAGWLLPEIELTKDALDKLLSCKTPSEPALCVPTAIAGNAITRAMILMVELKRISNGLPMTTVTATAVSPSRGSFVVLQRPCEQCTPAKITDVTRALVVQVLRDLASRAGDTQIQVVSSPSSAEVTLDGHKVGATDNTFTTYPGEHIVAIEKAGFEPVTRTVVVKDGQVAPVAVTLQRPEAPSNILPIALIGGGGGLFVGGVLVALDQNDGPDDKHRHTRATAIGVTMAAVGVAAAGTGIYLWLRGRNPDTRPASAPAVTPTASGVVLSWMGAF